jgi:hypothetical protein
MVERYSRFSSSLIVKSLVCCSERVNADVFINRFPSKPLDWVTRRIDPGYSRLSLGEGGLVHVCLSADPGFKSEALDYQPTLFIALTPTHLVRHIPAQVAVTPAISPDAAAGPANEVCVLVAI